MKVGDLHVTGVSTFPDEAETVAVVDPYTVLSGAVVLQRLQRIAGRTEIFKSAGRMKLKQFSNRSLFDGLKLPGSDSQEDLLGFGVPERLDHDLIVYRQAINSQGGVALCGRT